MNRMKVLVLCFLHLFVLATKASEKHLICKQVDDIFETGPGSTVDGPVPKNQGRPGKRGEKGRRGEVGDVGPVGPVGPRGIVDYKRVNDTIAAKLHEVSIQTNPRLDALEQMVNDLRKGMCRVEYESKCFWAIFSTVTFNQGQARCRSLGAEVANIYSKKHYDSIIEHVRAVMPLSSRYIQLWLRMTVDISSRQVSLPTGAPAPYVLMYPGYPRPNAGHTQMMMEVKHDKTTASQNMFNYDPSITRAGVLCELEL